MGIEKVLNLLLRNVEFDLLQISKQIHFFILFSNYCSRVYIVNIISYKYTCIYELLCKILNFRHSCQWGNVKKSLYAALNRSEFVV